MHSAQTLEKQINKPPLRCRLGYHRWTAYERIFGRWYNLIRERCARCMAERTVSLEIE